MAAYLAVVLTADPALWSVLLGGVAHDADGRPLLASRPVLPPVYSGRAVILLPEQARELSDIAAHLLGEYQIELAATNQEPASPARDQRIADLILVHDALLGALRALIVVNDEYADMQEALRNQNRP